MFSPSLRYLRSDPEHAEDIGLLRRRNGETWEFFAGRIIFVERNRAGRVIHMAGQAVSGKARVKYLFLPGLPKPVYGLARLDPSRPVFVVEGIVDYATLWQWGYQAVATLGTSIKPQDARRQEKRPPFGGGKSWNTARCSACLQKWGRQHPSILS